MAIEVAERPMTPMAEGGLWMADPKEPTRPPVYVVTPEHQYRLKTRILEEGGPWLVVPDPRDPQAVRILSQEADLARELAELQARKAQRMRETEMRAQIEALRAELEAKLPEDMAEVVATARPKKG